MPIKETLSYFLEMLSELRQQVTRLRDLGRVDAARAEIDAALKRYTGSNLELLRALPRDQLLNLLMSGGRLDADKTFFIAEMLVLESELGGVPLEHHLKALTLYLEAFESEDELFGPYGDRLSLLTQQLDGDLPTELGLRAFEVCAAAGAYARAEDVLFSLLEGGDNGELLARGQSFYLELLRRSDDALEAGGLPRDEVEESLRELNRRMP
jgi:hypothetical protein